LKIDKYLGDKIWLLRGILIVIYIIFAVYIFRDQLKKNFSRRFCKSFPGEYFCKVIHDFLLRSEGISQVEGKSGIYYMNGDYEKFIRIIEVFAEHFRHSVQMTLSFNPLKQFDSYKSLVSDALSTIAERSFFFYKNLKIISLSRTDADEFKECILNDIVNNNGMTLIEYLNYHCKGKEHNFIKKIYFLRKLYKAIPIRIHIANQPLEEFILLDDKICIKFDLNQTNPSISKIYVDLNASKYLSEISVPSERNLVDVKSFILKSLGGSIKKAALECNLYYNRSNSESSNALKEKDNIKIFKKRLKNIMAYSY
jgi:hypothetical protein